MPVLLDLPVVVPDPARDLLADVPGGVLPEQHLRRRPPSSQAITTTSQELSRDGAHGTTITEVQPEVLWLLVNPEPATPGL